MPSDLDSILNPEEEETVESVTSGSTDQSAVLQRVTGYAKRVEKKVSKLAKDLEERDARIAEFVKQEAEIKATAAAKGYGLKDEQVKAILQLNPNATPDQIALLAQGFGFKAEAAGTDVGTGERTDALPAGTAASPLSPEPLSGTQLPSQGIYFDEFLAMAQNPQTHLQAIRMYERGLVRNENKPRTQ